MLQGYSLSSFFLLLFLSSTSSSPAQQVQVQVQGAQEDQSPDKPGDKLDTTSSFPICDCHSTCRGPQLVYLCGKDDVWRNPCEREEYASSAAFCDESLDYHTRVADLIARIPMEEKLGSAGTSTPLSNYATELPSVGIPYVQWWNEALHGVAYSPGVKFDQTTPSATSFPQIISTSHSFNRTLFASIGAAIATEIRAFSNLGHAGLTYWTPNLNIFRDPRWGRGQETPGEDPYLTSEYVRAYVPALQYDESDPKHLKVSACCKHFVAYSLEDYEGIDRHHFNANVTQQDLADTYLPAFEVCASPSPEGAAASCIMCSYNEVNGVPSCANTKLLQMARQSWKFDGYITSDCRAVEDVFDTHHYAATPQEAIADVLRAGMDLECGKWFDEHLVEAYNVKKIVDEDINRALTNLLLIQMRLGRFDKNTTLNEIGLESVNSVAHQQLALEAAQQSVVLLKNNNKALPFKTADMKLAVLGPNANATKTLQGNYEGHAPFLISPLMALSAEVSNVIYEEGCEIESDSKDGFSAAIDAVSESDAVVLFMGLDQSQEREGLDRTIIALPGVQNDFIETILENAANKPVILVIMSGGAVCIGQYKDDDRVSSILSVGYSGQAGGQGIADVLLGRYNPSGRLTQTFYKQPFVDEISFYDMNMRPSDSTGSKGRGYRFYTGENIVYEFGYGLSFTEFEYQLFSIEGSTHSSFDISFEIKNVGAYEGATSALLFLIPPSCAPLGSPKKVLRNFDKVNLLPNQSIQLTMKLTAADFELANSNGVMELVHGDWTLSLDSIKATITI